MPENNEAVQLFGSITPFLGENMELPDCLPWLFEVRNVGDEVGMLEKITVLHGALRQGRIEETGRK